MGDSAAAAPGTGRPRDTSAGADEAAGLEAETKGSVRMLVAVRSVSFKCTKT